MVLLRRQPPATSLQRAEPSSDRCQAVALTAGVEQRLGKRLKRAAAEEAERSAAKEKAGAEAGLCNQTSAVGILTCHTHSTNRPQALLLLVVVFDRHVRRSARGR